MDKMIDKLGIETYTMHQDEQTGQEFMQCKDRQNRSDQHQTAFGDCRYSRFFRKFKNCRLVAGS